MSIRHLIAGVSAVLLLSACQPSSHTAIGYDAALSELKAGISVADLQDHMKAGKYTSVDLTQAALDQIKAKNGELHAVITVNPDALKRAKESDEARKVGKNLGPLMGIPVLIKDNIETADIMPTTAGSMALVANITHRDAPVVARLRAGGAIILGKTNLSEWANIRSTHSVSGWSGVGGLTANAVDHARTACGSSSGSGAGVAAGLAPWRSGPKPTAASPVRHR